MTTGTSCTTHLEVEWSPCVPADSQASKRPHSASRSTETFNRGDATAQLDLLERHFADVGWEAPQLLRAARSAPDFYLDSMGQVRLDRWSRGRVVLLGDAGYCPTPLTGLGTSLALVGAYILAGELAASSESTTAVADRRRHPRRLRALRDPDAPVR